MHTHIDRCRICGNARLERVLDLGEQMLTGVFPTARDADVTRGPLRLVKCVGGDDVCGLLQMEDSYDLGEMYGDNYGYRSGLNASMVAHLHRKVERISGLVELAAGDLVIDIGSNDATTLRAYGQPGLRLAGVDPTGAKFREFYPAHIALIPDFFSADLIRQRLGSARAKVVTSFSMFYDLPAPMDFMRQVHDVLADDGVWVFEQSYMPSMLAANSYDTVCHEHLEFYGLAQIKWMTDRVGLTIADVEFNDVNGGSFSVVARRSKAGEVLAPSVARILADEAAAGLHTLEPYRAFQKRVEASRDELKAFVRKVHADGKTIAALGASTKGNVLLQYCAFTADDLFAVGEVNPEKFGCLTPGSWIPIVSERELMERKPDYLLVLPWHFRKFFEASGTYAGAKLVFPLPRLSSP